MPFGVIKYLTTLLLFFTALLCEAQYSKVHYLPPTYNQNSKIQFSTITVTTLVEQPFDVSITNASGTYSNTLSGLSKTNPITVTLPMGDDDGIFRSYDGKTNMVLNSEGFIITADEYFFASQIHSVASQAAVIAPKGLAGLGTEFYSGHLYSQAGNTGVRSHFISVIASEDNTTVTFNNPRVNWEGQPNVFSVLLNRGESYVVAAPFNYIKNLSVTDKFNAFNGTHVVSDKPIAMNSGSFLASYSSSGLQDAGVDQIVPVDQLNNEFILVKGQASDILIETALIVATEDNTDIFVNGNSSPYSTLNKGEYTIITGDNYDNGTMHLKTSNPAMVYQNLAGSNSYMTLGMVFVPGLMEDASRSVLISGANSIGSISIYVVAKTGETVLINGVEIESTPIENLGNSAWVSYRIVPSEINSLYCESGNNCANQGQDANFLIESTGPINAAISLVSGAVGAAGYFSGFASVNTDVGVSDFGTLEYTLSCIQDTVSLFAKGASSYSWDSPSGDMNFISEVNDSTYLFNYDQSGDEGPFTYRVIMESTSILGYVQNDTVLLTINVDFTPECEKDFINEDTLFICLGDSIQINANNVNETQWYGEEAFTLISDSTIEAKPTKTTKYYFSNFVKKKNALINGDFEEPNLGIFAFIYASAVPGWNTTASDNQIEFWYDGFLGAPAYSGNQFVELNANMSSALYQDIPTTPNTKLMWGFAHRGRDAIDQMDFEVGPPDGPYEKIGTFSDGPTWKFYSGIYEVPDGQNLTRFYYTSTQGGSYGNLLDAIEFYTLQEEKDSIVIVVNNLPSVYLGKDTAVCSNEPFILNADSSENYLWNTSDTTRSIAIDSAGDYIVTITDENKCEAQDTISVELISCETNFVSQDTFEICRGDTLVISSENVSSETWWSEDEFNLINNSSIEVFPSSSPAVYYVGSSIIYADTIVVVVHDKPNVELNEDTTICSGDEIILKANVTGSYTWSTNENSSEIKVKNPGIYHLEIESSKGCLGRDSMELTIQELPNLNLGEDTSICDGEEVVFDTQLGELIHEWNNGDSTSQIKTSDNGIYSVKVIDDFGCYSTDSVELTLINLPYVNLGNDTSLCNGEILNLSAGNFELNHLWNTLETTDALVISSSGTYSVSVTDDFGCSKNDTINVIFHNLPSLNIGNDTAVCEGESIVLKVDNIEYDFVWNTGETASSINVSHEDLYSVDVVDENGCSNSDSVYLKINEIPTLDINKDTTICEGDTIAIIAESSALQYFWNTGDSTKNIVTSQEGIYSVTVRSRLGCVNSDSLYLSVNEIPQIDLGNDTTICRGAELVLNTNSSGYIYTWNSGENFHKIKVYDAGVYSVEVSDEVGCKDHDTIEVYVRELPVVDLGNDTLICENENLTLYSNYGEGYDIVWSTTSTENNITINSAGLYRIKVFDDLGCLGKDEINVSEEILPDPFSEKTRSFCEGNGLDLAPDPGFEDYNVYWLENKYSENHTIFESGVYSGIIEGNNCLDTHQIFVTKIDTPDSRVKDVNSVGFYCFEYQTTHLNVLTNDEENEVIKWDDFGETNKVEITEAGTYFVTVSNESCSSRHSFTVEDYCPGNLYIPNSFTPNNDGLNDVFKPVYHGTIEKYQFTVYNRWNRVVFTTNNINEGWNGIYENEMQTNDVYVYRISYNYVTQYGGRKNEERTGTVTLLR
ncbi:MAG: hypothetical protein CMP67_09085 [Flavobacteriales bacterium]|nr:hypothetical protein [Flavobacteriales bacterium]|tara:strand:- start:52444 stop:57456 length:5013 start_codon:yes stop_codon:yes gene_type:complete